jgi:uncharacterized protein
VLGHDPEKWEPIFGQDHAQRRKATRLIQPSCIRLEPYNLARITMPTIAPSVLPILMLFASNVFMTFAWYGHLKFKQSPLPLVIMVSWGIAFFEYWLAVPANRWGSAVYTAAQLKTMQEVITLIVFSGFSVVSEGAAGLESRVGFWLHRRRRVFYLSQMVVRQ